MPKRVYVGSHAAVEFQLPSGEVKTVAKGSAFDVDEATAKEMDKSAAYSSPTAHRATEKE